MFSEVAKQRIHLREVGAIDQIAALLLNSDQACVRQLFQMKRQCVARDGELVGKDAGRKTAEPSHDKRAKNA